MGIGVEKGHPYCCGRVGPLIVSLGQPEILRERSTPVAQDEFVYLAPNCSEALYNSLGWRVSATKAQNPQ